jgi:hypothetical protein
VSTMKKGIDSLITCTHWLAVCVTGCHSLTYLPCVSFQVCDVLQARSGKNVNYISTDCSKQVTSIAKGTLQGNTAGASKRDEQSNHRLQSRAAFQEEFRWEPHVKLGVGEGVIALRFADVFRQCHHPVAHTSQDADPAMTTGHCTASTTEPHCVCRCTSSEGGGDPRNQYLISVSPLGVGGI